MTFDPLAATVDFSAHLKVKRGVKGDEWRSEFREFLSNDGRVLPSTPDDIKEAIYIRRIANRPFTMIGEFKGYRLRTDHECHDCGHVWPALPSAVLDGGAGCPICARKRRGKGNAVTPEVYAERCREKFKCVPLEDYELSSTPIRHRCLVCDHEFRVTPGNLKHRGCPGCSPTSKINQAKRRKKHCEKVLGKETKPI